MCIVQVREEPYSTGGEEYLTFSHCTLNNGGAMDAKSGVFSASVPGQSGDKKDHESWQRSFAKFEVSQSQRDTLLLTWCL